MVTDWKGKEEEAIRKKHLAEPPDCSQRLLGIERFFVPAYMLNRRNANNSSVFMNRFEITYIDIYYAVSCFIFVDHHMLNGHVVIKNIPNFQDGCCREALEKSQHNWNFNAAFGFTSAVIPMIEIVIT